MDIFDSVNTTFASFQTIRFDIRMSFFVESAVTSNGLAAQGSGG